jgi:hypothetical protein
VIGLPPRRTRYHLLAASSTVRSTPGGSTAGVRRASQRSASTSRAASRPWPARRRRTAELAKALSLALTEAVVREPDLASKPARFGARDSSAMSAACSKLFGLCLGGGVTPRVTLLDRPRAQRVHVELGIAHAATLSRRLRCRPVAYISAHAHHRMLASHHD